MNNKEKIDVLFVADIAPKKLGSFETFLFSLEKFSNQYNIKIKYIFSGDVHEKFDENNLDYDVVRTENFSSFVVTAKLLKKYPAKMIHFNFTGMADSNILFSKILNVKNIFFTEHLCPQKCQDKLGYLSYLKKIRRYFYALNIDRIFSVSEFAHKRIIENNFVSESKIINLYNGIDINRFNISRDNLQRSNFFKENYAMKIDSVLITYVGQLIIQKGVKCYFEAILQILKSNTNVLFAFVGDGCLRDELTNSIPTEFVNRIKFYGLRNDIENIFSLSDVVVVPSICEEAFGLVAAEASACGLPVIATRVGGLPEVVLDNRTGLLVPPGDVLSLINAILKLADDKNLRLRLGNEGRKHIENNFDVNFQAKTLIENYREFLFS